MYISLADGCRWAKTAGTMVVTIAEMMVRVRVKGDRLFINTCFYLLLSGVVRCTSYFISVLNTVLVPQCAV